MTDYTDEQLCDGIAAALKARDVPAVVALLRLLAFQAPNTAQVIYDAMTKGTVDVTVPVSVFGAAS